MKNIDKLVNKALHESVKKVLNEVNGSPKSREMMIKELFVKMVSNLSRNEKSFLTDILSSDSQKCCNYLLNAVTEFGSGMWTPKGYGKSDFY